MSTVNTIKEILDQKRDELLKQMQEEIMSLGEDLTLEDFSVEELEEYMVSEEFEQLDEVSKETLKSYIKKASVNYGTQRAYSREHSLAQSDNPDQKKKIAQAHIQSANKAEARAKGISKAVDKLANK